MIEVKKVSHLLSEENLNLINNRIDVMLKHKDQFLTYDHQTFFRYAAHNPNFLVKVHKELMPFAEEAFKTKLKRSYCYLSLYQNGEGRCPKHKDRPQGRYTIDVCLRQKEPWGLYVNDQEYILQVNEAVLYSGLEHPHYRKEMAPGNDCYLAFFHFVDPDFVGNLD